MKSSIETYCGGFCGACPFYVKTKSGEIKDLAYKLLKPVDDIACFGCKSKKRFNDLSRNCAIRCCCIKKEIESCIECDSYPCKDYLNFLNDKNFPYRKEYNSHLSLIKNRGTGYWLLTCINRWSCKQCKTPYTWEEKHCKKCGHKVDGFADNIK